MRYWGFLVAKLLIVGGVISGLVWMLNLMWTPPTPFLHLNRKHFVLDLPYTLLIGVVFLLAAGLVYLVVLDQRYRCRVCLRRLRMPVETGSWSMMLQFGRPKIEYICIYGHGKLNIPEVQLSGLERPQWRQHGGVWEELYEAARKDEQE